MDENKKQNVLSEAIAQLVASKSKREQDSDWAIGKLNEALHNAAVQLKCPDYQI